MIVLDTHVLLWMDLGPRKFGREAKRIVDRAWTRGQVAISAVTFWEAALLQTKGRLSLPASADEWRNELLAAGFVELALNGAIAIRAVDLNGLPDDPADRLIVATALHHRAALVTADEKLLAWTHPLIRHDART